MLKGLQQSIKKKSMSLVKMLELKKNKQFFLQKVFKIFKLTLCPRNLFFNLCTIIL